MSRNGSGTFSLVAGNPVVTGSTISSTTMNNTLSDIATEITRSLASDGQTVPTANLPMGAYKHTNVANASSRTEYCTAGQSQDNTFDWLTGVSGVDTITATAPIALASYTAGQTFRFVSAGANTTTSPTLNINSIGAKSITRNGSVAIAVGDILSGEVVEVVYDGTRFQLINSVNTLNSPTINGAVSGSAVGTSANNLIQLDGTAKLPAIDGSQLTNLPETNKQIQSVSASVASNALTVGYAGGTLLFRSATLTNGAPNSRTVASLSLVVPSGATLGTVNAQQARLVLLAIDSAGTVELAVANLAGGNNLDETTLISTTAISAGSTASNVIYSTTARASVPFRVVGFVDITEATAGTWATAPSTVQGAGGQALAVLSSIGYGQTWQNVLGSRVLATTYYNTTGKPIQVLITGSSASATGYFKLTIGGVDVGYNTQAYTNASIGGSISAIVPPGASYVATNVAGSTTPYAWSELR